MRRTVVVTAFSTRRTYHALTRSIILVIALVISNAIGGQHSTGGSDLIVCKYLLLFGYLTADNVVENTGSEL